MPNFKLRTFTDFVLALSSVATVHRFALPPELFRSFEANVTVYENKPRIRVDSVQQLISEGLLESMEGLVAHSGVNIEARLVELRCYLNDTPNFLLSYFELAYSKQLWDVASRHHLDRDHERFIEVIEKGRPSLTLEQGFHAMEPLLDLLPARVAMRRRTAEIALNDARALGLSGQSELSRISVIDSWRGIVEDIQKRKEDLWAGAITGNHLSLPLTLKHQ